MHGWIQGAVHILELVIIGVGYWGCRGGFSGTCSSLWSFEPLFLRLELADELRPAVQLIASDLTLAMCAPYGVREMGVAFTEWVW